MSCPTLYFLPFVPSTVIVYSSLISFTSVLLTFPLCVCKFFLCQFIMLLGVPSVLTVFLCSLYCLDFACTFGFGIFAFTPLGFVAWFELITWFWPCLLFNLWLCPLQDKYHWSEPALPAASAFRKPLFPCVSGTKHDTVPYVDTQIVSVHVCLIWGDIDIK